MSKKGQTYFKNLAVFIAQVFKSIFGHFLTWIKGLNQYILHTYQTERKFLYQKLSKAKRSL